jgi:DNA invertase Pin-like site-specific DNA recombinase
MRTAAYLRTSSAANVEGDSVYRQAERVEGAAKRLGLDIALCVWDAAVSGADAIETRPGFSYLLDLADAGEIEAIIVEDASRFARSMIAAELGVLLLIQRGVKLLTASGDCLTDDGDPFKVAMRQVAAAFAQLEKARLVAKLKHARDAKRAATGRCEGRKPVIGNDVARIAQEARQSGMTLAAISAHLASQGHLAASGRPFSAATVSDLVNRETRNARAARIAA